MPNFIFYNSRQTAASARHVTTIARRYLDKRQDKLTCIQYTKKDIWLDSELLYLIVARKKDR